MLETLDHTIRIGSTPTFLYFDLYLYTLPTQHTTFIRVILVSELILHLAYMKNPIYKI